MAKHTTVAVQTWACQLGASEASTVTVDIGDGLQAVLPRDHPAAVKYVAEGRTVTGPTFADSAPEVVEELGACFLEYMQCVFRVSTTTGWWDQAPVLYLPAYVYDDGQYACISINLEADPDALHRPFVLACQDGRDAMRLAHSTAVREMVEGSEASLLVPHIVDASTSDAREIAAEAGAVGACRQLRNVGVSASV